MANVKFGGGVTDIRGSIGGTTFSRGAGGAMARQRTKGVNVRSALQLSRRSIMSMLTSYWGTTLTAAQRTAWGVYAAGTNFTNKVGDTIQVSGLDVFIRTNTLRFAASQTILAAAPTAAGFSVAPIAAITVTDDVSDNISIAEPTQGFGKSVVGDTMYVYAGFPVGAGRSTAAKGMRYVSKVVGAASPPTFPFLCTAPYALIAGQKIQVDLIHSDETGRVSSRVSYLCTVT